MPLSLSCQLEARRNPQRHDGGRAHGETGAPYPRQATVLTEPYVGKHVRNTDCEIPYREGVHQRSVHSYLIHSHNTCGKSADGLEAIIRGTFGAQNMLLCLHVFQRSFVSRHQIDLRRKGEGEERLQTSLVSVSDLATASLKLRGLALS